MLSPVYFGIPQVECWLQAGKSTPRAIGPTTSHVRNDAEIAKEASLDKHEIGDVCEWSSLKLRGLNLDLEKGETNAVQFKDRANPRALRIRFGADCGAGSHKNQTPGENWKMRIREELLR